MWAPNYDDSNGEKILIHSIRVKEMGGWYSNEQSSASLLKEMSVAFHDDSIADGIMNSPPALAVMENQEEYT